jgi:omega-amidase
VSLNQVWENKDENFQACRSFVKSAKVQGAELVIFPEMTLTAFSMNTGGTAEDCETSLTIELFKKLAVEFQVAIIFGVVFRHGGKASNNAVLIDANGFVLGSYSKIHPFSFSGEEQFFRGGNEICVAKLGALTIGLTICYDLRFPEIYSALGKQCDLIINIANWPARRISHWNTLVEARAIENQLFVAGVNRTGIDGKGIEYIKSSIVINPNGESLTPVYTEMQLDVYYIDSSFISQFKKTFSTTQDRKPEFYKTLL